MVYSGAMCRDDSVRLLGITPTKTTTKAEKRRTAMPAIAISFLLTSWNYVASMRSPDPYASMKQKLMYIYVNLEGNAAF